MGTVAFAGSRRLSPTGVAMVARVARAVVASGRSVVVGCCVGVDAAVLGAGLPAASVRVCAAFGPSGRGACSLSAVSAVLAHAAAGGAVSWFAGGPFGVPVAARLRSRTCAVALAGSAALVAFFGSGASRGTLLACQLAASRQVPVFAFWVGSGSPAFPSLGAGSWSPVGGSGVWSSAWRWVPGQADFFLSRHSSSAVVSG